MGRIVTDLVNNSDLAEKASQQLPADLWQVINKFFARPEIKNFFKDINIWKIVQAVAKQVLPGVWGLITGTASFLVGLIGLFVIGLYFIFLLLDYETVQGWKDLVPPALQGFNCRLCQRFRVGHEQLFQGPGGGGLYLRCPVRPGICFNRIAPRHIAGPVHRVVEYGSPTCS